MTFFGPSGPPNPTIGHWTRQADGAMPDGARATMDLITGLHDPDTHVVEGRRRYAIFRDGALAREAYMVDRCRWYSAEHATRLVEQAGVSDWTTTGAYTTRGLADSHDVIVLLASG